MYGIRGERELTETLLSHLAGYKNSKPVRIGNAAFSQRQNDVFGYLINVIYQYYKVFPGTLDEIEDIWEIVRNICRTITTQWEKPDKGIWEIRNKDQHFVFSKVMSWVAMDRAIKIAILLNEHVYAKHGAIWQTILKRMSLKTDGKKTCKHLPRPTPTPNLTHRSCLWPNTDLLQQTIRNM